MNGEIAFAHVVISGRVQGVGYRAWAEREAIARGLHGWVRNRSSGDVEAVFKGPKEAIGDMCKACWQGPPPANVKNVSVQSLEADKGAELNLKEGFFQIASF